MNRTGFPSPKKKKVLIKTDHTNLGNPKVKLDKNMVKNNLKSPKSDSKSSSSPEKLAKNDTEAVRKKMTKQVKMDRFITKKVKSSQSVTSPDSASKRSATQKPKNYR